MCTRHSAEVCQIIQSQLFRVGRREDKEESAVFPLKQTLQASISPACGLSSAGMIDEEAQALRFSRFCYASISSIGGPSSARMGDKEGQELRSARFLRSCSSSMYEALSLPAISLAWLICKRDAESATTVCKMLEIRLLFVV